MKAFVLAGGLGTRLRPRFGDTPKPLAPLGGQPFLVRQLAALAAHGITRAVILAGHGAAQLQAELGDSASGVALTWSIEPEPLGTGGALKLAERHVDGHVLVVNGDTLADGDPWAVELERWERGALGAVALYEVADARARGRVEVADDGRIERFVEKDDAWRGPAWVNGGVYTFAPALWKAIPEGASSLERDVLPGLAAEGRLHGRRCAGRFWDIGTPEDWARAEQEFSR